MKNLLMTLAAALSLTTASADITKQGGWLETAYAEWSPVEGATTYNVYIKGGKYSDFTQIDRELVRNYGSYGRADVVGLKAGSYALKIVPVGTDGEIASKALTTNTLEVKSYDRAGFAHHNYPAGIGAYNNDGTLKTGGKVLYITKQTAKTVKADVVTSSKGTTTACTGMQAIIDAYQKGYDKTPITFRIIGLVTKDDLDKVSSSAEGIQIKGKAADSELNITIEGIGTDATVKGFGFLVRNAKSVEMRNFGVIRCMDDGVSLDTDNSNIWVHHLDVFYGPNGGGDHAKGDGSVDVKTNSKMVTVSYCRFWDTGKTNMFGMKSEAGPNYISYHHNWFDHSDSRHPRIRTMSVHVWNNYFDNVAKYGVGATSCASVFVENNYFLNTKKPILSSQQGTDAQGSGTFEGDESGAMIKIFGNYFDRTAKNFKLYTQKAPASTGYDAYETATREEQIPATEVTRVGSNTYNNFDTDAKLMYAYTPDKAEDVPAVVTGEYGAGRMGHGDISYTFPANTGSDSADAAYDEKFGTMLDNYKSTLIGIFGEKPLNDGSGDTSQTEPTPTPGPSTPVEGSILCTFDKSGTPSSALFTVNGNGSNSKGTATVDGQTLSECLKLESSTSVKFSVSTTTVMTLYFADTETANIKLDGKKVTADASTYTTTLSAGDHELTKGDTRNLFAIKLTPSTTAVKAVKAHASAANTTYNLRGQTVAQPHKGLYIVNGKTAVVK